MNPRHDSRTKFSRTLAAFGIPLLMAQIALGEPDKKDDFPKFDDVVKDMEVREGFYTLYHDAKKDVLLARIPKATLGKPFLVSLSIPKGPTFAGWMIGGAPWYWERMDKKLVLMQAQTRIKKGEGETVEDVISRTYTDQIVIAVDIKTEAPGGDPVIDLAKVFKKDLVGLGGAYGGRRMDASLSRWSTLKAFPDNVEIAVDGAFMGKKPTDGGIIASIYYSLSKLPDNGYKPREADDRIGYFLTAQKDWTVDHDAKTVFKRYIHRWNLEKQDPDADLSPVKEPIVFYIEKTVPVRFRRYVREGIEIWNDAFERCGLLTAVQARQQTDTNEFKDIDPEDVRYNFFRWIVSGRAFARGPSRVNPYTGQILDADIIFDDSMVRFFVNEISLMGPDAWDMFSDPQAEAVLEQHPEYRTQSWFDAATPGFAANSVLLGREAEFDIEKLMPGFDAGHCELGKGMVHQMAFAQLQAAHAGSGALPERALGEIIREVVAHEVGHTLGLRHNFKASAWRKLEDIIAANSDGQALTGSVMDYNPAEYAPEAEEQGSFISTELGPYDLWAIEYGYRPFKSGGDDKSEADMLKSIADRAGEDGLAYGTDEDTSDFGPDPFTYRYDNGDDPVAYARLRMSLSRRLMKDLADKAVDDGESYSRLRRAFRIVTNEYAFGARIAARMIGGQDVSRTHKGEPNERPPIRIIPAKAQREALAFLGETVFSDEAFQFSPELLNKLAPGRFWHWGSDQIDFNIDYNVHDRVRRIQSRILTLLINPIGLNRIYDAELKVDADEDAFTVPELLGSLRSIVWAELDAGGSGPWTDRKPRISSFRRNLQREHLRRLVSVILGSPGRSLNADTHAIVRLQAGELSDQIEQTLKRDRTRLDTYTLAHLEDSKHRLDKALDAEFVDRGSRAASR